MHTLYSLYKPREFKCKIIELIEFIQSNPTTKDGQVLGKFIKKVKKKLKLKSLFL